MNFLSEFKRERAERVVADPSKFDPESVERVALSQVDAKLSNEEKIVEVYKIIGGAFGPDKSGATHVFPSAEEAPVAPRRRRA